MRSEGAMFWRNLNLEFLKTVYFYEYLVEKSIPFKTFKWESGDGIIT
jgi:hypothetical protein